MIKVTLNRPVMQEHYIISCTRRAKEKYRRLESVIDSILIYKEDRTHALAAFSQLINPELIDGFDSHEERRNYWKGKEFTEGWDVHYRNRLRKNNIIRALWFIANQSLIFNHANRDLKDRAARAIKEMLPKYDQLTISEKRSVVKIVDGLIHEFINFHCEEVVS